MQENVLHSPLSVDQFNAIGVWGSADEITAPITGTNAPLQFHWMFHLQVLLQCSSQNEAEFHSVQQNVLHSPLSVSSNSLPLVSGAQLVGLV